MKDKKSFVLYTDYFQHLAGLSDQEAGKLFKAIILYSMGNNTPELEGSTAMAFSFIRAQLDRDSEKWEEIREKRRESGKKGGKTTHERYIANQANAAFAQANQAVTDNDTDTETVNDTVTDTVSVSVNDTDTVQQGTEAPCVENFPDTHITSQHITSQHITPQHNTSYPYPIRHEPPVTTKPTDSLDEFVKNLQAKYGHLLGNDQ